MMTPYIVVSENEIVKAEMERPVPLPSEFAAPSPAIQSVINNYKAHCLSLPRIVIQGKHNWKVWQGVPESEVRIEYQIRLSTGRWAGVFKYTYDDSCDEKRRIVAIPIQPTPKGESDVASKPVGDVEEMARAEADKWVFETNGRKWSNNDDTAGDNFGSYMAGFKSGYAAAPQKGMNELFNKLKREFEFVGDEKISGITALRLIKPIFDESPSPSEAGDAVEIIDGYTQLAIDRRSLPKDGQHVKFMTENEEFHEGYFVGGDDIFHVTDSKFFFKWHVQQWKGI